MLIPNPSRRAVSTSERRTLIPEDDKLIREFQGWSVQPSLDQYGTYHIPEIAQQTENARHSCKYTDQRVARLIEAAPDMFLACRETMDWIEQARHGTLNDVECAMGRKIPQSQMREALGKALGEDEYAVCQNCETSFFWLDLDPIDDLRQRVETGEPLPAGQCPDCGALCYDLDTAESTAEPDSG